MPKVKTNGVKHFSYGKKGKAEAAKAAAAAKKKK